MLSQAVIYVYRGQGMTFDGNITHGEAASETTAHDGKFSHTVSPHLQCGDHRIGALMPNTYACLTRCCYSCGAAGSTGRRRASVL